MTIVIAREEFEHRSCSERREEQLYPNQKLNLAIAQAKRSEGHRRTTPTGINEVLRAWIRVPSKDGKDQWCNLTTWIVKKYNQQHTWRRNFRYASYTLYGHLCAINRQGNVGWRQRSDGRRSPHHKLYTTRAYSEMITDENLDRVRPGLMLADNLNGASISRGYPSSTHR